MPPLPVQASSLLHLPTPQLDFLPTGLPTLDATLNGIPRGAITEVSGPRSCGKTSLSLSTLAQATARGETCAIVDPCNRFDPASAALSGVVLENLIWTRSNSDAAAAMKITDLLLHGGGMGVVCLDLFDIPPRILNRIPISYWYRFRRAIENTPAILLVLTDQPVVRSCAMCSMICGIEGVSWSGGDHLPLLDGIAASVMLRKPAHSSTLFFAKALPVFTEPRA